MEISPTVRQDRCLTHLLNDSDRYILYGGAKGGGKSYLLCVWALIWAKMLCDKMGIYPGKHPIPLGFLGRKQSVDFKKTTLETWKKTIPSEVYVDKPQDGELVLFNGSCKLFYGGLDRQETINKFNSAELAFFALDQAEETTREDVAVLRGSLRLKHNDVQPTYKELYTANPSDCWLKEDFVDRELPKHVYIPALPSDNPYLPDDYVETLEQAFKHSPPLLKAYRDGDWSALKSTNTLLSTEDLNKLKGLQIQRPKDYRVLVCDPATTYDECVIYVMHNYEIIDQMILVGEADEMKIAGLMAALATKHKCLDIGGDSIGLGSGIFSRLEEIGGYRIHRINSSNKSGDEKFRNVRAEFYWKLMQKVLDKQIHYPEDEELRRQLVNITYEVVDSSGLIKITKKDDLKKVLGRSPDRADAFAMGVYLTDLVEPWQEKPKPKRYVDTGPEYDFDPMTV